MNEQDKTVLNEALKIVRHLINFGNKNNIPGNILGLACNILSCMIYQDNDLDVKEYMEFQPDMWGMAGELVKSLNDQQEKIKASHLNDILKEAKKEQPELFEEVLKEAKKRGDDYLFSPEIRERLSKFNNMSLDEMLGTEDFWREMFAHAGVNPEEFEKIKKEVKKETKRKR